MARRYGALGRPSGSCGFRRGEPPRLLTPVALAKAGAFFFVGERKGENLLSQSRINEVFYYLKAAPEWQARSLERKHGVGGSLPIQRGLLYDTLKRSTESGRKAFS